MDKAWKPAIIFGTYTSLLSPPFMTLILILSAFVDTIHLHMLLMDI